MSSTFLCIEKHITRNTWLREGTYCTIEIELMMSFQHSTSHACVLAGMNPSIDICEHCKHLYSFTALMSHDILFINYIFGHVYTL